MGDRLQIRLREWTVPMAAARAAACRFPVAASYGSLHLVQKVKIETVPSYLVPNEEPVFKGQTIKIDNQNRRRHLVHAPVRPGPSDDFLARVVMPHQRPGPRTVVVAFCLPAGDEGVVGDVGNGEVKFHVLVEAVPVAARDILGEAQPVASRVGRKIAAARRRAARGTFITFCLVEVEGSIKPGGPDLSEVRAKVPLFPASSRLRNVREDRILAPRRSGRGPSRAVAKAPIVKWILRRPPKPKVQVQFLVGVSRIGPEEGAGAGTGNRTLVSSLGSSRPTIERHPPVRSREGDFASFPEGNQARSQSGENLHGGYLHGSQSYRSDGREAETAGEAFQGIDKE